MAALKVGQTVTVRSIGRIRRIVRILGDRALCKAFSDGREDWFPLSDLEASDEGPMRPFIG